MEQWPTVPATVTLERGGADRPAASRRRVIGVPLVVAVVVVVVAELVARVASAHLAAPNAWPSPELQKKYDQIVARAGAHRSSDVVLVGDSMMDAAGNPAGLRAAGANLSIYNASIAGETLPTIAEWTMRVVVPRLHPKMVVIGMSSNELNPAELAPVAGFAAYRQSRAVHAAEGTGNLVDRADAWLRQKSYLYRYRKVLRHPLGNPAASAVFDPRLTGSGQDLAFVNQPYLAGGVPHAKLVLNEILAILKGFKVGPDNIAILQNLLTSLHRQGIAVVFVAMPVTADLISLFPGGAPTYEEGVKAFGTIAAASGTTFLVPGVWPSREFADPVHLNGVGSAHFSAYLLPVLNGVRRAP